MTDATTVRRAPRRRSNPHPPPTRFRPDIEGMRAIAVGMVLLYHAGISAIPGGFAGVDVFFVISGFLITTMILREVEQTGTLSLSRFYARRIKRLLPAAAVVLVVTSILTWLVGSVVDRKAFGGDIASAALYVVNWRLADRSVDYLAEDVGASPVQHFWSLAVEEQFYILWPLLLLLVAWWVRRNREPIRPWLAVALCAVGVPSLLWSVLKTIGEPSVAFFVTTTRLWELAVGAGVAVAAPALTRLRRVHGVTFVWLGLAAVVMSALFITTGTTWPGYAALLPVLGTAAVIAGGSAVTSGGPVTLLGSAPMVWVGGLSYSLYLWHWPMLVLAKEYWGELSTTQATLVVGASIVPAWVCFRLVENPVRHAPALSRSPGLALSVGVNLTFLGMIAGFAVLLSTPATSAPETERMAPGAAVLGDEPRDDPDGEPVDSVEWMTPEPVDATEDAPPAYDTGCQVGSESSEPVSCEYGDPDGDVTVALVGDSKALQWITALDNIGQENGWRVVTYTKSACSFTTATLSIYGEIFESCSEWNDLVVDELLADPPDLMVTSQVRNHALDDPEDPDGGSSSETMVEGLVERWNELDEAGIKVTVLADTPQPGSDVYKCAAEHPDELTKCAFDRHDSISSSAAPTLKAAVDEFGDAEWINLNDAICPADECAPVIGNVLVYRQGSHLTVTYVNTLRPRLATALEEIVE